MASNEFNWQDPPIGQSDLPFYPEMANVQEAEVYQEGHAGPSSESAGSNRSPLHRFGLGFLEGIGVAEKKANRDGQAPKKRGPKRDSKPALTRRQELNRQAQRTHRERKETYIKGLEAECMQLRELYAESAQEKQAIEEVKSAVEDENRNLKELLRANGIQYPGNDQVPKSSYTVDQALPASGHSTGAYGYGQSQRLSPSHTHGSLTNSPGFGSSEYYGSQASLPVRQAMGGASNVGSASGSQAALATQQLQPPQQPVARQQTPNTVLNYDHLGVDFVLALEAACMDHLQYMCVRSNHDPQQPPSGHALMMSCPPYSHIESQPEVPYPHKSWDLPPNELIKLFQLSQNLPLDGEITPVIALNKILTHPRFSELTLQDFEAIREELRRKTRCYGFGAVLEEFELHDAMNNVLATKPETQLNFL